MIVRSKWLPKEAVVDLKTFSSLKDIGSGRMCCLGVAATAAGVKDFSGAVAYKMALPDGVTACFPFQLNKAQKEKFYAAFPNLDAPFQQQRLADVNDSSDLEIEERERKITELFAQAGVKVTFKGALGI